MAFKLNELSEAVVLCTGYGVTQTPALNSAKLAEIYGQQKGAELFNDVLRLTNEAAQIQIDWLNSDLEAAGKTVHVEMHNRYPQLDSQALDAIAWKFTYDWR